MHRIGRLVVAIFVEQWFDGTLLMSLPKACLKDLGRITISLLPVMPRISVVHDT